ncbi:alkaline phosphatase, partial [Kibdelosporangium lantanae]
MRKKGVTAVVALSALVATVGVSSASTGSTDRNVDGPLLQAMFDRHPRNVIFFLGDGMGTQEITAARYYQGVRNKLNVDRLAVTGFDTTWSVKPGDKAPYLPDYDPDSASTGTEWATGTKTLDERISQ